MSGGITYTGKTVKISNLVEQINHDLERLLFIDPSEAIGNLDKGSFLTRYFFEPINEETMQAVIDEIANVIKTYEPRIILKDLKVHVKNKVIENYNLINIKFDYEIVDELLTDIKEKNQTFNTSKLVMAEI